MAIRLATEQDAGAVQAIYAPVVRDTAISFEVDPPSVEEMARRIRETWPRWPWLVLERDGNVVGYAYAGAHRARPAYRWSVDVTIYVAAGARRGGVGRALYTSLLAVLALQGYVTAWAGITLPNAASVALHEAVGFVPVGVYPAVGYKLGAWRDVGWWRRRLRPPPPDPEPPLELAAASRLAEWPQALASGCRTADR
ncbi:MAG TPA: arsinothricin resistance N-acetyltransferase ArsN1 family B [Methylomirabilota bacterium]|jgi:L-amino acid N-acyltransferase YncA|nr:arsinothricin resistance N-acetyltransferase ArsN1 family B [Methylomirabilota bacterium]